MTVTRAEAQPTAGRIELPGRRQMWVAACAASPIVTEAPAARRFGWSVPGAGLDRYWRQEAQVAGELVAAAPTGRMILMLARCGRTSTRCSPETGGGTSGTPPPSRRWRG